MGPDPRCQGELLRLCQFFGHDLRCRFVSCAQFCDPGGENIKADHWALLAEFQSKLQAKIAQADNGDHFCHITSSQ